MSNVFSPINAALYAAVRDAKACAVQEFEAEGVDLNSDTFLARFPFIFVKEFNKDSAVVPIQEKLIAAAFSDEFRSRTEETIGIFYANHGGGTTQSYFLDMVDDFLNYTFPRTLGLSDEETLFDDLYCQFETDLFSETYTLNVIALLENISDHGGSFHPTAGLRFAWADRLPNRALNTSYGRKRTVPYLEIKKTAHPLFAGRDISDKNSFFILEFAETRAKRKGELTEAYNRSEEITRKTVFASRLLTSAPVYADYRGFRTLGHYSGGGSGMVLMNYPDERIDEGFGQDLKSYSHGLERLFPPLLAAPADSIAVLYDKIEDAFRRQRRGIRHMGAEARVTIDRLLDYFQALEAIIQIEGSYQIALYAAVLLRAASQGRGMAASDVFEFMKDMHTLRNDVVHGRIDKVLQGRTKTKHKITEIERFCQYVHELAILYLLNPGEKGKHDLRPLAHRLALGETVNLKTLYQA